jgi:hypothetical protein
LIFEQKQDIEVSSSVPPTLQVVVDTEEEFDWAAPPDRNANNVAAMKYIHRVQDIFDEYSIKPCYVIDYPVASKLEGYEELRSLHAAGKCEIGAHLQPWVNPPYDEELNIFNMYPGNLKPELERSKLRELVQQIETNFGFTPTIYKAGRYGLGAATAELLSDMGFKIDLSVCPPFDNRRDGGPDYSEYKSAPFWFASGDKAPLMEIPVTGGFVGFSQSSGKFLYKSAMRYEKFKLLGLLSRLSIVDRLMLSPEGFSCMEHQKLTRALLGKGVRHFTWSFHSPSVVPGNTPYVRNKKDLENFLDSFKVFFDFFLGELGGVVSYPSEIYSHLSLKYPPRKMISQSVLTGK